MSKLRIFHGLSEVAGQAYYSVKGLRECGAEVNHMVWMPNPFNYDFDVSLNVDQRKKYLLPFWALKILFYEFKILKENDIFHFHYGRSLLFNYDLWAFRKIGKKLYFEFHGSDLRDYKYAKELNNFVLSEGYDLNREKIKKRAEKICRYVDGIILHDDELIPHLPAGVKNIFVVPLRIDLTKITPVYVSNENSKIRIVHAPTKRDAKGSNFVIQAVQSLQNKYPIELILVENKTQEEALELYKMADIIVDQLRTGTYGVFAIEGMAMGKPVVTYITDEMKERLPEELPICSANPKTIESELERLIKDGNLRRKLGVQGRKYVEKYHDYKKNARMLLDIYNGVLAPIQGRDAFEYAANKKM